MQVQRAWNDNLTSGAVAKLPTIRRIKINTRCLLTSIKPPTYMNDDAVNGFLYTYWHANFPTSPSLTRATFGSCSETRRRRRQEHAARGRGAAQTGGHTTAQPVARSNRSTRSSGPQQAASSFSADIGVHLCRYTSLDTRRWYLCWWRRDASSTLPPQGVINCPPKTSDSSSNGSHSTSATSPSRGNTSMFPYRRRAYGMDCGARVCIHGVMVIAACCIANVC